MKSRVIDNEDFTNFCALKWNETTYKPVNKGGHKITTIQGLWTKTYGIREGSIPSRLQNQYFNLNFNTMKNPIKQQMVVLSLFNECPKLGESAYAIRHYDYALHVQAKFSIDAALYLIELGFDSRIDENRNVELSSMGKVTLDGGKLCKKLESNVESDIILPFKIEIILT